MHRNPRLFLLLGLLLMFMVFFGLLFYIKKHKPSPPKPPVVDYRIPASDSTSYHNVFFYDFENFKQPNLLSSAKSFSGRYAMIVRGKKEFSLLIQKPLSEMQLQDFSEAGIGAWIQSDSKNKIRGKLMFQIVDKANSLKYSYDIDLKDVEPNSNNWFYISGKAMLIDYQQEPTDIVKVYYWNNFQDEVYVDEVLMVFGKQQMKGDKPLVDETADNYKFSAQSNKPPYPTIYACMTFAENLKNTAIQSLAGEEPLEIKTGDSFLTGNFITGKKSDQLLLIRNNFPYAIIWFMPEKNVLSFKTIDRKVFPAELKVGQWVVAEINGDGTDEIIFISNYPQKIEVFAYQSNSQKAGLILNVDLSITKDISQVQKFHPKGDKKDCLFAIDVKGKAFLLIYERNHWNTLSLGTIREASMENYHSQIFSGNFVKADGNDNILLLYREKKSGRCFYKLFDIDASAKNTCLQQGNFDNKCDTLYPLNTYFTGDINGDGISELISYGNQWRFDMKLVRFSGKDYNIMGNIDFKGYEADHNPKYYDDLMMAAGNFADDKNFSFFTVCKNHKPAPDLPETIGIYSLLINGEVTK
jgi:hypothetical protein